MSDDIRRKKKKQTKKTKAEDAAEIKPALVIEEKVAKVSKKTLKDESETIKRAPASLKTIPAEKKEEKLTANVFSKLVFFVSILGTF